MGEVPDEVYELLAMAGPRGMGAFHVLDQPDVERLAEAALTILDRLGMTCQSPTLLEALDGWGARVDLATEQVTFPRSLVEDFIRGTRAEAKPDSATPSFFRAPPMPWTFHPLAVYFYDGATQEKRAGNREDFITMTKLGDVLHPERGVGHSLLLSDVPSEVEPLEAALLLCEWGHRPRGVYVQDVRQIPYLQEMEDIAGISDPYWHWMANVSFSTPLRLGHDIAERFVLMVRSGRYPAQVYNFAVSGVNMPATVAGCAALAGAELLALWMAARALSPNISLEGGLAWIATADMRTGDISYSGYDATIRSLATCEFLRRWTGVTVSPGGGEYNPSSVPGTYTALEKAYRAMTVAAFTGVHPAVGLGHVEAGLSLSPVQLLLDREVTAGLGLLEHPPVDEDTLGLDTILSVGHGEHGTYLETEHTLRHFRSALWQPRFFDRGGWAGVESEQAVLARAQDRVQELLAEYRKPEFDPDRLEKMRRVVDRARREMQVDRG